MNKSVHNIAKLAMFLLVVMLFLSCSTGNRSIDSSTRETGASPSTPISSAAMSASSSNAPTTNTLKFVGGESEEILKAELIVANGTFTLKQWRAEPIPLDESSSEPKVGGTSGGGAPMGAGPSGGAPTGPSPEALKRALELNEARKKQPPNEIITGNATVENRMLVLVILKVNGMEPYSKLDKAPQALPISDDGSVTMRDGRVFRRVLN